MPLLVLSLFPGIGLLDAAFEQEGFCIVKNPDLLWGGDIRRFHVPSGRFDGVIGGTPCQAFSQLSHLVRACGRSLAPNLIPEFERVCIEAQPAFFMMENVKHAPLPVVDGYRVHGALFNSRWMGDEQSRLHRFSFGTRDGLRLDFVPEDRCLDNPCWSPRVLASGGVVALGGSGKPKRGARHLGRKTAAYFNEAKRLQGLPPEWDLPGFTMAAKVRALGNAVPLPMGRAVARAVRRAIGAAL